MPARRNEHRGTGADGTYGSVRGGTPAAKLKRVFILYAVLFGLIAGLVSRGSPARLGALNLKWAPLIVLGLVVQLLLFSSPVGNAMGDAAPVAYVVSDLAVLAAVAANRALPGLALVLVGGASNLLAIVANGGYMPASPEALAVVGRLPQSDYSNSAARANAALAPLTDLFAMPPWVPFHNVFSVGDVLIGVGVAIAVVAAMHGRTTGIARPAAAPTPEAV